MHDPTRGLVDQIDHFGDRRCFGVTGDDDGARDNERGVARLV